MAPAAFNKTRLQVVVMVMTAPGAFEWRQMFRKHWGEMSRDVVALGRPVDMVMRFAVGKAPRWKGEAITRVEEGTYGDIARLDVQDGVREAHSDGQHGGKIWYLFKWALKNYPDADLFFKQDDDNIVNWRIALPTMLSHVQRQPVKLPMERLYLGRLQFDDIGPCGMGELYGFTKDVVTFAMAFTKPELDTEDVATCKWVVGMELFIGEGGVDRGGLLSYPAYENAWIHPVKDKKVYESCFQPEAGCAVEYPWNDKSTISFRVLPDVEAARVWLAQNSTAKQEDLFSGF